MEFTYTEDQIREIAPKLLAAAPSNILCFYGSMGAGKTTLIKALVSALGGAQQGNSPTFGIVNEYGKEDGSLLGYHFDFYRIEEESEAFDLGFEDYLAQDTWIFIEWPELVENLIPEDATRFQIEIIDPRTRKITFSS